MPEIYPCRVIITSNKKLARHYNEDPESALMGSYCLTIDEAFRLFEGKRNIETIILVNGAGEDFVCHIAQKFNTNMPDVVRIDVADNHAVAVTDIRKAMYQSSLAFIWIGSDG